eukprot:6402234-Amphidinium_carterae.1
MAPVAPVTTVPAVAGPFSKGPLMVTPLSARGSVPTTPAPPPAAACSPMQTVNDYVFNMLDANRDGVPSQSNFADS